MTFKFHNDLHNTSAAITVRNFRITQIQLNHLWGKLCGYIDCPVCNYGGLHGPNKWRLKKLSGILFYNGAEIVEN